MVMVATPAGVLARWGRVAGPDHLIDAMPIACGWHTNTMSSCDVLFRYAEGAHRGRIGTARVSNAQGYVLWLVAHASCPRTPAPLT